MEWDDDQFTREPLDAAKLPSHDDRDSDDSSPVEEPLPDDEFIREALDPTRPTGSRTKRSARRVLLGIGGCALLAIIILASTGTAENLWRQARFAWLTHTAPTLTRTTITSQPPGKRTLPDGWQPQSLKLPPPSSNVPWTTPAPDDPNTSYGCSALRTDAKGYQQDGPLGFWYTHDAGQHWSNVPIPQTSATYCNVIAAPDMPQHLALVSQYYGTASPQDVACSQLSLFLSSDGGVHWHTSPTLPDPPIQPGQRTNCTVTPWPTARHLYLYYYYTVIPSADNQPGRDGTSLVRSDDGGQTWKRLDANLPPGNSSAYPRLLDDGETLLLNAYHYDQSANDKIDHEETQLWVSRDAGDSWEPWGRIQGLDVGQMMMDPGKRWLTPSLEHPLYLLSGDGILSLHYRIQIAQVIDKRHYAPLPPLPIAGASPEHLGITSVLAETPSGKLLVFGLGPDDRVPTDSQQQLSTQQPAQQWLWEWNPQSSQWILLMPALDVPWTNGCSDHCWRGMLTPARGAGETGMYLTVWHGTETGQVSLFGITLPGLE